MFGMFGLRFDFVLTMSLCTSVVYTVSALRPLCVHPWCCVYFQMSAYSLAQQEASSRTPLYYPCHPTSPWMWWTASAMGRRVQRQSLTARRIMVRVHSIVHFTSYLLITYNVSDSIVFDKEVKENRETFELTAVPFSFRHKQNSLIRRFNTFTSCFFWSISWPAVVGSATIK